MNKDKKILIVDDSDMDRTILKAMLCDEFEVIEKCGGYTAVDFLKDNKDELDVLLLDILMPGMDGFGVLQFMKDADIDNIPVFLITAEATKDNVKKAAQFGVSEFIRKPFDRDYIVKRIQWKLGIVSEHTLTSVDIQETDRYISELQALYKRYLINCGEDHGHYSRIVDLMKILLSGYAASSGKRDLEKEHIEIISKAGYFCDIGNMIVPPMLNSEEMKEADRDDYQDHTILGADLISLNHSNHCRFFVDICTDICMHHHERYDGQGFPHKITGDRNLIYTQICRLVDKFDSLFMKFEERIEQQFDFVLDEIGKDKGNVSEEVISVLMDCREDIVSYYNAVE